MRRIELSTAFRRDVKRVKLRPQHCDLDADLAAVIGQLALDQSLAEKSRDHALSGDWAGFRECHLRPDLLLIYEKAPSVLRLVRLGSHSDLFR